MCKEWNQFILEQERKLEEQWELAGPTISEKAVTVEDGATIF